MTHEYNAPDSYDINKINSNISNNNHYEDRMIQKLRLRNAFHRHKTQWNKKNNFTDFYSGYLSIDWKSSQ